MARYRKVFGATLASLAAVLGAGVIFVACSACCLLGDSMVLTPDGPRRIDELRPGDEVLSYDVAQRRLVVNRVEVTFSKLALRHVWLEAPGGQVLGATTDHKLYDPARDTYEESAVATTLAVVSSGVLSAAPSFAREVRYRPAMVYDIGLENEPHNYVANGLLVHNHKQHHVYNLEELLSSGLPVSPGDPIQMVSGTDVPAVVEVTPGVRWAFQAGGRGGNLELLDLQGLRSDHYLFGAQVSKSSSSLPGPGTLVAQLGPSPSDLVGHGGGPPSVPIPGFGNLSGETGVFGVFADEDGSITGDGQVVNAKFSVFVSDGVNLASRTVTLVQSADLAGTEDSKAYHQLNAPQLVPVQPPEGKVGRPYAFCFALRGGQPPYSWTGSITADPPELADAFTFGSRGTLFTKALRPTVPGKVTLTVRATDAKGAQAFLPDGTASPPTEQTVTITIRE